MVAKNTQPKTTPRREPTPLEHVRAQIAEHLGGIAHHFHVDGTWLWYCGPSLQQYPEARQFLKDLGFRFARRGHVVRGTTHVGTWGHSCQHPTPFRRRRKGAPRPVDAERDPEEADSAAPDDRLTTQLAALGL